MKAIPILFSTPMVQAILEGRKTQTRRVMKPKHLPVEVKPNEFIINTSQCPYGQVGDVLWVRESFCRIDYGSFLYKSEFDEKQKGWKPSIHMPKAACRIFLELKALRVERLQDISNMDAINEGIECLDHGVHWKNYLSDEISCFLNPKHSFESLWKSINGPESWDSNPWVWVIDFKRIEKPTNWPSL